MGNELTQYQKDLIRMWDSLRAVEVKGNRMCTGVSCDKCPFIDTVCADDTGASFNAEKAIEIVTQWANDHPFTTMADKYKATFGVLPKGLICPKTAGFDIGPCLESTTRPGCRDCSECKEKFWNSEFKKASRRKQNG